MVKSANEMEEAARQKIARVTTAMHDARVPTHLIRRCRRHLTTVLLHRRLALDTRDLFAELSAPLRAEYCLHRCHKVRVWEQWQSSGLCARVAPLASSHRGPLVRRDGDSLTIRSPS